MIIDFLLILFPNPKGVTLFFNAMPSLRDLINIQIDFYNPNISTGFL